MGDKLNVEGHDRAPLGCRSLPAVIVAAWRTPCVLAALSWAILAGMTGCAVPRAISGNVQVDRSVDTFVRPFYPSYGTIAVKDLQPAYQAASSHPVKTADLAKLALPFEAEARIQVGDLLEVSCSDVLEESKRETFPVHVADDGTISLPLVPDRLPVGSLTAGEAEHVIRNAYARHDLIRQLQVTLRTVEHKTHTIYVIGAVKKPGVYELQSDECDPLRAIAAAEGVTEDAVGVVEVRRAAKRTGEKSTHRSAPRKLTAQADGAVGDDGLEKIKFVSTSKDAKSKEEDDIFRFDLKKKDNPINPAQLLLQNGDIVSVEQKTIRPIYVAGSVNKPGEFPMPAERDIRTLEAIGLAGGVLYLSEPTTALIIRRPKGKNAIVIHVDLARAASHPEENLQLMEGDVVSVVEDAASRTRKAIRTFINLGVSLPVRFPF
jgi:protein involved in polysaccharide export with SLBB domain